MDPSDQARVAAGLASQPAVDLRSRLVAEDFSTAAVRHWHDGSLLQENGRLGNADQLYGFAAECAVKSVLTKVVGEIDRFRRQHIEVLWDRANIQSVHRGYPALATVLRANNPFTDWTTDHRYAADNIVGATALARHRQAAVRLLGAAGLTGTRAR